MKLTNLLTAFALIIGLSEGWGAAARSDSDTEQDLLNELRKFPDYNTKIESLRRSKIRPLTHEEGLIISINGSEKDDANRMSLLKAFMNHKPALFDLNMVIINIIEGLNPQHFDQFIELLLTRDIDPDSKVSSLNCIEVNRLSLRAFFEDSCQKDRNFLCIACIHIEPTVAKWLLNHGCDAYSPFKDPSDRLIHPLSAVFFGGPNKLDPENQNIRYRDMRRLLDLLHANNANPNALGYYGTSLDYALNMCLRENKGPHVFTGEQFSLLKQLVGMKSNVTTEKNLGALVVDEVNPDGGEVSIVANKYEIVIVYGSRFKK